MTTLGLRNGVTFCRIGLRTVFLDIERDRYFGLSAPCDAAFARLIDGDPIENEYRLQMIEAGVLAAGLESPLQPCAIRPVHSAVAAPRADDLAGCGPYAASLIDVVPALVSRARWARRVKRRTLAQNLTSLRTLREALVLSPAPFGRLQRIELAHRRAALIWSTSGRCLPTAMAIFADLSHGGIQSKLVFGVQLGPFAAHCWVEAEGRPVGDDPENVEHFTPIRIV